MINKNKNTGITDEGSVATTHLVSFIPYLMERSDQ